jgi:hypothetical protein
MKAVGDPIFVASHHVINLVCRIRISRAEAES